MALAMVEGAERRGALRPGMTVVEYTGGSTGSSLAFVCAVKGYRLRIATSDAFAPEKLATMRAFGADLTIIPSPTGLITPDLIQRMIAEAKRIAETEGAYWTDQFRNTDSIEGYRRIGDELLAQADSPIDAFCAGVGFVPPLLTPGSYDEARGIDEGEARRMARRLAREAGIFAGVSTGLNVVGALQLARELGPGKTVATVACDSGLKYLNGDLFAD